MKRWSVIVKLGCVLLSGGLIGCASIGGEAKGSPAYMLTPNQIAALQGVDANAVYISITPQAEPKMTKAIAELELEKAKAGSLAQPINTIANNAPEVATGFASAVNAFTTMFPYATVIGIPVEAISGIWKAHLNAKQNVALAAIEASKEQRVTIIRTPNPNSDVEFVATGHTVKATIKPKEKKESDAILDGNFNPISR